MNKNLRITNIIINSVITILTIVAIFVMFFGTPGVLASTRWSAFKYFTVQSNLYAGIASLISLIYLLFKKDKEYPLWVIILKLTSAVGVGITFLTVVVYLGPLMGYLAMIQNANLYMHLIIPVLALVSFPLFEPKRKIKFIFNLYSMIPVTIYGIIYLSNVAAKNDYGNVKGADWYAFGTYGIGPGIGVLLGLILFSFLISMLLLVLHQKTSIKALHNKKDES